MMDWFWNLREEFGWRWLLRPLCWIGLHDAMHGVGCNLGTGERMEMLGCRRCDWMKESTPPCDGAVSHTRPSGEGQ